MKTLLFISALILPALSLADGINCSNLSEWSTPIEGMQVNQHHIFCGEPAKSGNAKGFHSMPQNQLPSDYLSSQKGDSPNASGIYTLKKIALSFNKRTHIKSFSSMFPDHCTQAQVNASIVFAQQNASGNCANPSWAKCGPNAPDNDSENKYCKGFPAKYFEIATAVLPDDSSKINTGFPIYTTNTYP